MTSPNVPAAFADASFNPRTTALMAEGDTPEVDTCAAPDEVEMPHHGANGVQITANMGCRGMVILTDAWYPGWRAWVDGQSTEIHEVYGGVRGAIVPAGRHTIEMRYRPWSVLLGFLMTLLASLAAALAAWRSWWRSPDPGHPSGLPDR
jgi:hypothetical protein